MNVKVVLVDINPKMVAAWRASFEEEPDVEVVLGSMLQQAASAWVTPTNSRGRMDGGLDAVLKAHFGPKIEAAVQGEIARSFGGRLRVGQATCVATGRAQPGFVISTPTMRDPSEDISDTLNVALACAAAFQAVALHNRESPGSIRSVVLPGLGANTGKVPVEIVADLMWTAFNLFRDREFPGWSAMRAALEEQLGELGPSEKPAPQAQAAKPTAPPPSPSKPSSAPTPSKKAEDVDFDDFD